MFHIDVQRDQVVLHETDYQWRNPYHTANAKHDNAYDNRRRVLQKKWEEQLFKIHHPEISNLYSRHGTSSTPSVDRSFTPQITAAAPHDLFDDNLDEIALFDPPKEVSTRDYDLGLECAKRSSRITNRKGPCAIQRRFCYNIVQHPAPSCTSPLFSFAHGGASVWVVNDSGNACIASSTDGTVVSEVRGNGAVTCVHTVGCATFIGLEIGTVIIIDNIRQDILFESDAHSGSVLAITSFVEGGNAIVSSISASGDIVVWRSATGPLFLEWQNEARQSNCSLTSVAVSDSHLYLACDEFVVDCMTIDTFEIVCTLEGANTSIVHMLYLKSSRLLLCGCNDGLVLVYCTRTRTALKKLGGNIHSDMHRMPICAIIPDTSESFVWTISVDGQIRIWDFRPGKEHRLIHLIRENRVLRGASASPHIDSATMYSFSRAPSLGQSSITGQLVQWKAAGGIDNAANSKLATLSEMVSVEEATLNELESIGTEISTFELIYEHNCRTYMSALAEINQLRFAARAFSRLRQYRGQSAIYKYKSAQLDRLLVSVCTTNVIRPYYNKLVNWLKRKRGSRVTYYHACTLATGKSLELLHRSWSRLGAFARRRKASRSPRLLATVNALAMDANRASLRSAYSKLQQFVVLRERLRFQESGVHQYCGVAHQLRLMAKYYYMWNHSLYIPRRRDASVAALEEWGQQDARRSLFIGWMRWARSMTSERRERQAKIDVLSEASFKSLAQHYFGQWINYTHELKQEKDRLITASLEGEDNPRVALQFKTVQVAKELRRYEDDSELQEQQNFEYSQFIAETEDVLEMTLRDSLAEIEQTTNEYLSPDDLRAAALEVAERLRAACIDIAQDLKLLTELHDKCRRAAPQKFFLEAHSNIKRVIVSVSQEVPFGARWRLDTASLAAIRPHQWSQIYSSSKQLIVAYDHLDKSTVERLKSDDEIAVNGQYILILVAIAKARRRRAKNL